jgi:hypothetical protein
MRLVHFQQCLPIIAKGACAMIQIGLRTRSMPARLRGHLMQRWFALSDPVMEEALYEIASLQGFARLNLNEQIPDETTILNFRHLSTTHLDSLSVLVVNARFTFFAVQVATAVYWAWALLTR